MESTSDESETATRNREHKTIAIAAPSNTRAAPPLAWAVPLTSTLERHLAQSFGGATLRLFTLTNGGLCILYSQGLSSKSF
jgi:hypothetical protein